MSENSNDNRRPDYERDSDSDYGHLFGSRNTNNSPRPDYRAKRRPTGHNGMHRRRQKRWSW